MALIVNPNKVKLLLTQDTLENLKNEISKKISDNFKIDSSFSLKEGSGANPVQKSVIKAALDEQETKISKNKNDIQEIQDLTAEMQEEISLNKQNILDIQETTTSLETEIDSTKTSIEQVDALGMKTEEPAAAIENLTITGLMPTS